MPTLYNRRLIHHYIMPTLFYVGQIYPFIMSTFYYIVHAINISLYLINTAVHYQDNIPCSCSFYQFGKKSNVSLRSVYDKIKSFFLTIYRCVRKQRYSYNRWYVQIITVSSLFIVSYFTILAIKRST